MRGRQRIQYKSADQIRSMRRAGLVVAAALDAVREHAAVGVTTKELDKVAEESIRSAGATPSFLGYSHPPYPASICTSVNDEVVHGIPGERALQPGDLLSVDCGAVLDGWHGDAAITIQLPDGDPELRAVDEDLSRTCHQALWDGIAALATGDRVGVVGDAVEDRADGRFGVIEDYTGHGIGTSMHMPPEVLNFRSRYRGPRLRPGLVLAIEPMLVAGEPLTIVDDDQWTVRTADTARAAHWEHTVAITDRGLWVLTAPDGGQEELAARAVPVTAL